MKRARQLIAGLLAVIPAVLFQAVSADAQVLRFIRDAEIESLLNDYAKPIFQAAGVGANRISMRIVNDKSFNAFVLDGRNVFINSGAIMQAETPNEIIGVIAHETGHIAGGHLAALRNKIERDVSRNLLMKVLGIGALIAAGASGSSQGKEIGSAVGQGLVLGGDGVMQRSILAYQQVQESSADQAGVAFLTAAHESANGMIKTFERFAEQELFSDQLKDPYARSHPVATTRLNQLKVLAQRSPYFSVTDPPELQLRHDLVRAKLHGYLDGPQRVGNRYPSSDDSLPAQYARAIAAAEGSSFEDALPKVDALLAAKPGNPYFWELKGDLFFKKGDASGSIEFYRKALKLAPQQNLLRISLAQAMVTAGDKSNVDEVIALLKKALVAEDNPQGYRQLANAYSQKGDDPSAYLAAAKAYLLEGNVKDAKSFARRAQASFKQGSPEWIKADDIISLEEPS